MTPTPSRANATPDERVVARLRAKAASGNEAARRRVAQHPDCPPDLLLEMWREDEDQDYRSGRPGRAAIRNPNFPVAELSEIALTKLSIYSSSCFAVLNPSLPASVVKTLLSYSSEGRPAGSTAQRSPSRVMVGGWETARLLAHPNCPVEVIREWQDTDRYYMRAGIAQNINCPPDLLIRYARDKALSVRAGVAANPSSPDEALALVARNAKGGVMVALLERGINVDEITAHAVAGNAATNVRRAVAAMTEDPEVLTQMSMDRSRWVRTRVVKNEACPDEGRVAATLMGSSTSYR